MELELLCLHDQAMRFLIALLFAVVLPSQAAELLGRIVHVADGDTVTVLDETKTEHVVRLAGIDAPEKGQPFGQASRQHLRELAHGRYVVVDWYKVDRYGRLVGLLLIDGRDANLRQVQAGLAWWYRAYSREQTHPQQVAYAEAERAASEARVGLWQGPNVTPPWEYRQRKRASGLRT